MELKSLVKLGVGMYALKKILKKIPLCDVCKIRMKPDLNFRCDKCGRFKQVGFWSKKESEEK